ncbi:hypothetical protein A2U01_0021328 [Trifolium medium]|uniref:Uncharacterized protein n=1 Tax=Trifolium medium TaxID=97028 RepID=A0A392NM62_9FABA|nr:hypothetical protein [Trifolium medium]
MRFSLRCEEFEGGCSDDEIDWWNGCGGSEKRRFAGEWVVGRNGKTGACCKE